MPYVTYNDLEFSQRCIYQAFTQLNGVGDTGVAMGALVNAQHLDADDSKAVVVLADHYGLKSGQSSTGQFFNQETGHEANSELIAVISSGADALALTHKFPAEKARLASEVLWSKDPVVDACQWHAVYASVNGAGALAWNDPQAQRPNGPWNNDFVVYYSTA